MSHHHLTAENVAPFADRAIAWAENRSKCREEPLKEVIITCAWCRDVIKGVLQSGEGLARPYPLRPEDAQTLIGLLEKRARLFDDGRRLFTTEIASQLKDDDSVRVAIDKEIETKEKFIAAAEKVCKERFKGAPLPDVLGDQAGYAQIDSDATLEIRALASTARNAMALELFLRAAFLGEMSVIGGGQGVHDDPVEMPDPEANA